MITLNPGAIPLLAGIILGILVAYFDKWLHSIKRLTIAYKNAKFITIGLATAILVLLQNGTTWLALLNFSIFAWSYWYFFELFIKYTLKLSFYHQGTTSPIDVWLSKNIHPVWQQVLKLIILFSLLILINIFYPQNAIILN